MIAKKDNSESASQTVMPCAPRECKLKINSIHPLPCITGRKIIITPDPTKPFEAGGVLNPAAIVDDNGIMHLFCRVVACGNISRIDHRIMQLGPDGDMIVTSVGIVLEPDMTSGWSSLTHKGGVEDPRLSWIAELAIYVMTYTIFDGIRAKIALAISHDLYSWKPLGLACFKTAAGNPINLNAIDNKDGILGSKVYWRHGKASLALFHRPMFEWLPDQELPPGVTDNRQSIWISFCYLDKIGEDLSGLLDWVEHSELLVPLADCESAKLGGGTPPMHFEHGSYMITHGVRYELDIDGNKIPDGRGPDSFCRVYTAGWVLLDPNDPTIVLARSTEPLFRPELPEELVGIIAKVVFPTAIVRLPGGRIIVLYGAADFCVGIADFVITSPEQSPAPSQDFERTLVSV